MESPLFFTEVEIMPDGTTYQVIDVQNVNVKFAAPIEMHLTLNDNLSFALMRGLNKGLTITIPIATVETKGEGYLVHTDFSIEQRTTLQRYKRRTLHRVRSIFSLHLTHIGGMTFFHYLNSFARLAAEGYFITDANREEKYLEIIATNDEVLISMLEAYLNAYDLIEPVANMWINLKTFEDDIALATNKAEVDDASQLFDTGE